MPQASSGRSSANANYLPTMALAGCFVVLGALILRPGIVMYDGSSHYAYLHSAVIDRNLDFSNEIAPQDWQFRTTTGRIGNYHPVGPAVLWSPFFLGTHAICAALATWFPQLCVDGYASPYLIAVAVASAFYGYCGLWVSYRLTANLYSAGAAIASVVAVWLASPLLPFMFVVPSMPHAVSFGASSMFFGFWWIVRQASAPLLWFVWGLIAGILVSVRWQSIILTVLPLTLMVFPLLRHAAHGAINWRIAVESLKRSGLFVAGLTITFSPQLLVWAVLYGEPLTIPQGADFFSWTQPKIMEVLFSSRHGLFSWMPIAMLACVGLVRLSRRSIELFTPLIVILGLQIYVNSVAGDWWGGGAFGPRRFSDVFPVFMIGLAGLFDWARSSKVMLGFLAFMGVLAILGNWILMTEFYSRLILPDEAVTWEKAISIATAQPIPLTQWLLLEPAIVGWWRMGPYGDGLSSLLYGLALLLAAAVIVGGYRWAAKSIGRRALAWRSLAVILPLSVAAVDIYLWLVQ